MLEQYQAKHLSNLAKSTIGVKSDRLKIFTELADFEVESLTSDFVHRFFIKKMQEAIAKKSKRKTFNEEIKDLKSVLNWYSDVYNPRFLNPVTRRLKNSCIISKEKKYKEKLSPQEFLQFYEALDPFYKDVALVQTRIAGRISEVAGLQFKNVSFDRKSVLIKDIVVYGRRKEFVELKPNPKTGEIRPCHITPDLHKVIQRCLTAKSNISDYVFHINGHPIKYRAAQYAYDKALKKVGLYGRFSGTHILRHFTACVTRDVCQTIDSRHSSVRQSEHYSGTSKSLQAESITKVEAFLNGLKREDGCAEDVQVLVS